MDRFAGARYSSYTLRRFYPSMIGENLTYAPPQFQYGDPQKGSQQGGGKFLSSLFEFATDIGTQYVGEKMSEARTMRELSIEQQRLALEQNIADREAKRIAFQEANRRAPATNYLPWVLGGMLGLGVLAVAGVAVATKK